MAASDTRFTWKTTLTPEQVREALERRVQPGPILSFELGPKAGEARDFRGEVTAAGFTVVRRAVGRSSFAPIVRGVVRAVDGGAEVDVTMALPRVVLVFLLAWVATAVALVGWFIAALPPELELGPALALLPFPLVAPLVGWLVFSREVQRAAEFLRATLPAAAAPAN